MKIGLIGYGKMGREIEKIAIERGHSISMVIDVDNIGELTIENLGRCDVVIEFTMPVTAVSNYMACFDAGVPVVSGTTGWLSERDMVHRRCEETGGTFFYASNFSLGVNLFFRLNRQLAALMGKFPEYQVFIRETHHATKKDAPSGTAITLAEAISEAVPSKSGWERGDTAVFDKIVIASERTGNVTGIHTVEWESENDIIEISHQAKNRKGLAQGAVIAAEFCMNHKGILTMNDLLKNKFPEYE